MSPSSSAKSSQENLPTTMLSGGSSPNPTKYDTQNDNTRILSLPKRRRHDDWATDFERFKVEMKEMVMKIIDGQTKEIKSIGLTLKDVQKTNENIEESITFLMAQNEEYKNQIIKLEGQVKEDRKYITVLEDRIEDLQRTSRKSNFELKNVPKRNNETKEDLVGMVVTLSGNVGSQMEERDIADIYRIRNKKETTQNSTIIVETTSAMVKSNFLKTCKLFNVRQKTKICAKHLGFRTSEDTPIFVAEQLTAKGSRLHFLARDLVKSRSYKFCWTAYGVVYVRKDETSPIIRIHSEAQLQQLKQSN